MCLKLKQRGYVCKLVPVRCIVFVRCHPQPHKAPQQALLQSSHICKVVVVLCCTTSLFCFACSVLSFIFHFSCCRQISLSICSRGHHLYCLCAMETHTFKQIHTGSFCRTWIFLFSFFYSSQFHLHTSSWLRDKRLNKSCDEAVTGRACQFWDKTQEKWSQKLSKNGLWSAALLLLRVSRSQGSGARFECQSDACAAHFKPGNFCTMLALRSHAAGNHLLVVQCRGALRTHRWTDEKCSTGRSVL